MAICSEFYPLNMVIYHSYVSLPEGTGMIMLILLPLLLMIGAV